MITRFPRAASSGGEPLVHAAVHQQAVNEDELTIPLAVDRRTPSGDPHSGEASGRPWRRSDSIRRRRARCRSAGPLPRPGCAKRAQDGSLPGSTVERVEVDARGAVRQSSSHCRAAKATPRSVSASASPPRPPIAADGSAWDRRIAEIADADDLGVAGDRDRPGDDRNLDPGLAGRRDEVQVTRLSKKSWVIRKLRAGVDLGLQVGEVGGEVGGLGVHLGKAGTAEGEVVALGDEPGELGRARQPALRRSKSAPPRRVASQGQHVRDARLRESREERHEPVVRLADAAQMRHRLEPVIERIRLRSRRCPRGSRRRLHR